MRGVGRLVRVVTMVIAALALIVGGTFLWALLATGSSQLARVLIWWESDTADW